MSISTTTDEQIISLFKDFRQPNLFVEQEDSALVVEAKQSTYDPYVYEYIERDIIIYNMGVGATGEDLPWVYENDDDFAPIPTFGVNPQLTASSAVPYEWLPEYTPTSLLHGEQYLKIVSAPSPNGTLITDARIMEVLDKGKAAAVTTVMETRDKHTGELIYYNTSTVFIRGCGGFGGKRIASDRGPATAVNEPPARQPDTVIEETTSISQAALYRLNGDWNPLHILPSFAAMGGFEKPILHGLCTMGICGKHILKAYGSFEDIKVRFSGVVYPGETIVTEMWKEGPKVIFQAKVKGRGSYVLTAAAVTLNSEGMAKL